jgi:hypothetical protein
LDLKWGSWGRTQLRRQPYLDDFVDQDDHRPEIYGPGTVEAGCQLLTAGVPAGKLNTFHAWLMGSGAVGGLALRIQRAA